MTNSEMFKAAHAATKVAMFEQASKHLSARKTYAQLFALCLRGAYINEAAKLYVPVEKPKFMFLTGM